MQPSTNRDGQQIATIDALGNRTTTVYDAVGNETAIVDARGNRNSFTYYAAGPETQQIDPLNRRTTIAYDAALRQNLRIDARGNRTTYTFDANGNQQIVLEPSGNRTTNTWNFENLTTKVEQPGNSLATYTWNADNHRVAKNVDSIQTKLIWDEENILLETDGSDATQVVYTMEPQIYGNLISERRKIDPLWIPKHYHFDALGATRNITGTDENVTDSWLYDASGTIVSHTVTEP